MLSSVFGRARSKGSRFFAFLVDGGRLHKPKEVRQGVELFVRFDQTKTTFAGTVKNTPSSAVEQIRVEVHLSNGTELGPTPRVELKAGETKDVLLEAGGQSFTWYSVRVELGSGDHGREGGD